MEDGEFRKQVGEFFTAIYKKAIDLGGDISGEHGVGLGKVRYFKDSAGEINFNILRGIKKVFDPKLILNPGKVCYFVDELTTGEA